MFLVVVVVLAALMAATTPSTMSVQQRHIQRIQDLLANLSTATLSSQLASPRKL
jgi:hypothetical protein